jgi:hypothetical protein
MKMDPFSVKHCWWYSWPRFSWAGPWKSTGPGRNGCKKSSITVTKGWMKRPSRHLQLAFLFLSVAGSLALGGKSETADPLIESLLSRGWGYSDSPPCAVGASGFYVLETEESAVEFFLTAGGGVLSPTAGQWPEGNRQCFPLAQPSFTQEIP